MTTAAEAAALAAASRKRTFQDQAFALVGGATEFAFDALRLVVSRGVDLELAMTLIFEQIDEEVMGGDVSALGVAIAVLQGEGIEVPAVWHSIANR